MSKLFFKIGLILSLVFTLVVSSARAEKKDSKFLFTVENNSNGDLFKGGIYRYLVFEINPQKSWGKQIYTARLKKAVISNNLRGRFQVICSYYESGEPFSGNKPDLQELAVRFLERHTVRFSFKDEKLVLENGDSLQTAFTEESKLGYRKFNDFTFEVFYSDFKFPDLLNDFNHIHITLPEELQKPGEMSLIKGFVYNYIEDVGPLQHLQITDVKKHSQYDLFVSKGSNRVKYKKIGWGTTVRTFDPDEKNTMQINGTLSDQKNKSLECEVKGTSFLDPVQKIQLKTDVSGNFSLLLDQDFPVSITLSSGHQFYAEPGDYVTVKSNSTGDSLFFKGIGAYNNEYLQKETKMQKFPEIGYDPKDERSQAIWFKKADKVTNDRFVILKNYNVALSPRFYESKYLTYYFGKINRKLDYIFSWFDYSRQGPYKRVYSGLDTIPAQYQSFGFNRELNKYLENKFLLQFEKLRDFTYLSDNMDRAKAYPSQTEMLRLATLTYSGKILRDYLEFNAPRIFKSNKPEDVKAFQDIVNEYFDNTKFQSKIARLDVKASVIEIGSLFPSVKFRDMNRVDRELSQHRGKVIYLMFWRNDALSLDKQWYEYQQLVRAMKDKEVVFVNVGMEVDFSNWKKNVELMKLDGLNLFLDRNSDDFKKYFSGLRSRHFILIDSTGKIVNNNGPDPSVASVLISQNMGSANREEMLLGGLVFFMAILLILGLAWLISRTRQKRRAKIDGLLNRLRETELKAIKAQMNPHFLFNSLNSIQNLINQQKIEAANMYLSKFARLLRSVLQHSEKEFVPLADEIETLTLYVQLEKLRFNFDFEMNIADDLDVFNTYIPPLLLQPFIENAILHGLQPKIGDKKLVITIEEHEKQLVCRITDNGVGRNVARENALNHHGMGNKLSEERIKLLNQKNNSNFMLHIKDGESGIGGTQVTISFANNLI